MKKDWRKLFVISLLTSFMIVPNIYAEENDTPPQSQRISEGDLIKQQNDYMALEERVHRLEDAIKENEQILNSIDKQIKMLQQRGTEQKNDIHTLQELIEQQQSKAEDIEQSSGIQRYFQYVVKGNDGNFIKRIISGFEKIREDREFLDQFKENEEFLEKSQIDYENEKSELEMLRIEREGVLMLLDEQNAEKPFLEEELHIKKDELQAYIKGEKIPEMYVPDESVGDSDRSFSKVKDIPLLEGEFTFPTVGTITKPYGNRTGVWSPGIEVENNDEGPMPVVSAADGIVLKSYFSDEFGNILHIRHETGAGVYEIIFSHLDTRVVQAGVTVDKGMYIGTMGNSFPLHIKMFKEAGEEMEEVNPLLYLGAPQ